MVACAVLPLVILHGVRGISTEFYDIKKALECPENTLCGPIPVNCSFSGTRGEFLSQCC